jgi:hypothetical protein
MSSVSTVWPTKYYDQSNERLLMNNAILNSALGVFSRFPVTVYFYESMEIRPF